MIKQIKGLHDNLINSSENRYRNLTKEKKNPSVRLQAAINHTRTMIKQEKWGGIYCKINRQAEVNIHLSGITTNGFDSPVKRHRLGDQIQKQAPSVCRSWETQLATGDKQDLRVEVRKVSQANGSRKQADVAVLIYKTSFQTKTGEKR